MLVGYMDVSTDNDRQSTDLQRDALLAAGVDPRHLFEDRASGARDDRTGLTKALAFLQPGDVLVVRKLDRLGRSLSHLLAIVNSLKAKRVAFRSLTENLDTTTPSGEFLFQVFGALAQYERVELLARGWRSRLVDLGKVGHLNPASGFGEWPRAHELIGELALGAAGAAALTHH